MNFKYLLTPVPAASLLVLAGVLMLIGAFSGRIAWLKLGLQVTGFARLVAFLTGGVCVAFGLYLLAAAPQQFWQDQSIRIESAIYGRGQFIPPTVPPFPVATLDCTPYARGICDTHPNCSLSFSNRACGSDPDAGSMKVAEVIYRCGNEPSARAFFVEGRAGTLVCR